MSLFNGMTHTVLFFNTLAGVEETGINAMMKLCFGSDDNAIAQILYRTPAGGKTPVWTLPTRRFDTQTKDGYPIFSGKVGEELLALVGRAADIFKAYYKITDGIKAGRAWRITKNGIEEIIEKEKAPAKS